ncbi:hypothetical protein GFL15_20770 [Rhizobium leguminosarum bv. viciae]|nr:hypothetical protein [Rhizobium leguminosarum bv. viciae]
MRHNGCFATRESFGFDTERHDVEKRAVFGRHRALLPKAVRQEEATNLSWPRPALAQLGEKTSSY